MPTPASALIVDDEAHVRVFLRLLLKEVGISTLWEATDGTRALELVQEHHPELVLLDVNMPVMTGLETLARLQETHPDVPVIMVSSESALSTVREAARLGAMGYILKQIPKEQALKSLRELLAGLEEEGEAEEA
jgi:two-component system chemotaxis response regulator CheY